MLAARFFLDSNVLVYLRDATDAAKHRRASKWQSDLAAAGLAPVLSWQVLREYYSVVTRKASIGLARAAARQDIAAYRRLLSSDPHDHPLEAWRIEDAHGFNFYDCLILASALNAGATHLLTEDMQHGQFVDGLRIVNPFAETLSDLSFT